MAHAHEHTHTHGVDLAVTNNNAFKIGIGLNIAFVIAELIAGFAYDSVSLLTDAGHNASDVASLLISLLAFRLATKKATEQFTYGYKKTTVLAALANAVILLVAIGVLGYESFSRLRYPEAVEGNVIAWVAALGIVINSVSAFLFFRNKDKDLNIKSAYLHLLADALVSLGVVVGGIAITFTSWYWLDPVIGLGVMVIILISTWSLLVNSFKMAVDAVPTGIDVQKIKNLMQQVPLVKDVHHIHIWPLSTTENALTAHVVVDEDLQPAQRTKLVQELKHELEHQHIQHSTIELEYTHAACEKHIC
jgi:cobalt-zinc-cadmium efflux system protein